MRRLVGLNRQGPGRGAIGTVVETHDTDDGQFLADTQVAGQNGEPVFAEQAGFLIDPDSQAKAIDAIDTGTIIWRKSRDQLRHAQAGKRRRRQRCDRRHHARAPARS